MLWFSWILFLGSLGWLYSQPDWEPALFSISMLGALIYSDKKAKAAPFSLLKTWFLKGKQEVIVISAVNTIDLDNESLTKLISNSILESRGSVKFKHEGVSELRNYANKKEKDINTKHSILERAQTIEKRLSIVAEGYAKLIWLIQKKYISCQANEYPKLLKKLVQLVYAGAVVATGHRKFDIYHNELHYPIYLPDDKVNLIEEKLNSTFAVGSEDTLSLMTIPKNFVVMGMPEDIIFTEIVPAHIYYGLTRYVELKGDEEYWGIYSWHIGLG